MEVADEINGNASASGQPTGGAPTSGGGGFTVPDGYELTPKGYRDQAEQWRATASGATKFYQTASKFGLKDEDSLNKWGGVFETANKRKLTPAQVRALLAAEEDGQEQAQLGRQPEFDPEEFKKEMENKFIRQRYELEHRESLKGEQQLLQEALKEFYGDEQPDEYQSEVTRRAMLHWLEENRPTYPSGHPLANDYLAPIGKDHTGKASAFFRSLREKAKGAAASAKADATLKAGGKQPPLNGTKAGQGKATESPARRPDGKPAIEAVEAAIAARRAARGG